MGQATPGEDLAELEGAITSCRRCPRLVEWREGVAADPPRRFRGEPYWARPVPGFGDPAASILIVGLAPAAHGANRTGRMFTGDRSGDWLYAALHRAGLASRPTSVDTGDGLTLNGVFITAVVRCAPPANRPSVGERDNCLPWLEAEFRLFRSAGVLVALGSFAWDGALRATRAVGGEVPRPKPRFGHCEETAIAGRTMVGSYHPSQQNTFTGRLTEPMLDRVFARAKELAGL
ncbi:MAG: uracil-DNA glycosylase [Thermoleophilia bacterium]|nr:uracil-DNA glycosylase [Thermoleophilia bacterium]